MNGMDFILSQSGVRPLPPAPAITPPGGGKLSVSQTVEILARHAAGESQSALAREFKVSQPAINYLVRKQRGAGGFGGTEA